ncbi:glycoside hydrolase superfamily [Halenospora varia]|nr:glycoside hydrolase superfamily [Halenospora varia]
MRRYSFEEPYDGRRTPPPQSQAFPPSHSQQQPRNSPPQYYDPETSPPPNSNPAAHPDSSFNRLRAERRYSRERGATSPLEAYGTPVSPTIAPAPPPHRDQEGRYWGRELGYTESGYSETTPGADNFGPAAAGGLTGVAMSVADTRARESGLEAMRNTPGYDPQREMHPHEMHTPHFDESEYQRPAPRQEMSSSSLAPLGAAAFPPGMATPQSRSTISRSPHSFNHEPYSDTLDTPYRYSRNVDPNLTEFDPNMIEDDGDDGLEYRNQNRGSMLSLGHHSTDRAVPVAAGAAAGGGIMGTLGGLVGKNNARSAPQYNAVGGPGTGSGPDEYNLGGEKSEWLNKQSTGSKKLRWIVGIIVAIVIAGAIAGGVVGALLGKKKSSNSSGVSSSSPSGASASQDTSSNGDLNKNSDEIKKLLNNKNLHKVFPGIDYTPMYTQYPDCLSYPASQNNVTRDLAIISQLTNTVRLYGTDCNQTELVLHSIDQLGLNGTMKVWMGVWQDTNATTNARQLEQMYKIFDTHGSASFVGVIVGNEVLFRKDMTATQLGTIVSGVKTNLTARGIKLPVASADLGDNWTSDFASKVDYLMANIHPFFGGIDSKAAAGWTWDFWQGHDVIYKPDVSKNIISETGWPSRGGTDCGGATTCTGGSVAGISEMNNFLDSWVCQALANGTNYFWFEAFDEPWKIKFNEPGKEWEDQWGMLDVNRNLKPGVVIPSCGGKTVT